MKTVAIAIIGSTDGPAVSAVVDAAHAGIPRTADGKPNLAAPAPRTPDGKPDFSGLWTRMSRTVFADLKPVQAWVDPLVRQRREDFNKDSMSIAAFPSVPGTSVGGGRREHCRNDEDGPDSSAYRHAQPRSHVSADFLDGRTLKRTRTRVGWATRSGAGRETRWWWRAPDSTIGRGWIQLSAHGGVAHDRALPASGLRPLGARGDAGRSVLYANPFRSMLTAELTADTDCSNTYATRTREAVSEWSANSRTLSGPKSRSTQTSCGSIPGPMWSRCRIGWTPTFRESSRSPSVKVPSSLN